MLNTMIPAMEQKIKELKELKAERDELDSLIGVLEDEIKEAMGEDTELRAGAFKVTYKEVNSTRFDSKTFKADYPDLYGQYTKTYTTRPFKVA